MPYVINGIGTWYHGKSNIHKVRGVCESCNSVGDLKSYDTSNYFVIFFIPIIPLKKVRVLNECPYCKQHRHLSSKKWIEQKTNAIRDAGQKIRESPGNPEVVINGLDVALSF